VIALYLESLLRGSLFAEMAYRSTKPIVLLKGGSSEPEPKQPRAIPTAFPVTHASRIAS